MTEAQDACLGYPCGECGADIGEPCPEGCPGTEFWSNEELDLALNEVIDTPPSPAARLAAAIHRLPLGGLVGIRGTGAPDRQDYPLEEWIEHLADWMTEYQRILTAEVEELQAQVRKGIGLQIEKDVLRNMLGVGT